MPCSLVTLERSWCKYSVGLLAERSSPFRYGHGQLDSCMARDARRKFHRRILLSVSHFRPCKHRMCAGVPASGSFSGGWQQAHLNRVMGDVVVHDRLVCLRTEHLPCDSSQSHKRRHVTTRFSFEVTSVDTDRSERERDVYLIEGEDPRRSALDDSTPAACYLRHHACASSGALRG